jgi:hypothetical protein
MVGLTSSFFFVFLYFENRDFLHIKKKRKMHLGSNLKLRFFVTDNFVTDGYVPNNTM